MERHSQHGRDWGHLQAIAVQAIFHHCCPASKSRLREVCLTWHDALVTQYQELYIGPGSHLQSTQQGVDAGGPVKLFPAAHTLHVTSSSSRDYPHTYTEDLAELLSSLPNVAHLTLQELHEMADFDNLDVASLWDSLAAAGPALGRLRSLSVSDCFWNTPELFGVLRQLTGLTQLRLSNNPLETACEVNIIASLSQLRVLEFGLIFDGSSQHHDVPRALEGISNLQLLEDLSLPMWRRSLGGRAHPLAPALSAALGCLTKLTSLAVDGKFGHLAVVSSLTNLKRLAGAAPLSMEGWQAISQLPQLTLLTSLTAPHETLQWNPPRPHNGLDLATLATKGTLQGLDVAVMKPEHLATLGQFTQLQRLNLRSAGTFSKSEHQAQILTAISCLPASLIQLRLGPLLPLSEQLLQTIASSCPNLKALHASFGSVEAACGVSENGSMYARLTAAAAAAGALSAAADAVLADGIETSPASADAGGGLIGVSVLIVDDTDMDNASQPAAVQLRTSSVSQPLQQMHCLQQLELVLLGSMPWTSNPGSTTQSITNGPEVAGDDTTSKYVPLAELQLSHLPQSLQQLTLSGPWLLSLQPHGAADYGANMQWQQQELLNLLQQQQQRRQMEQGPFKVPNGTIAQRACMSCGKVPAAPAAIAKLDTDTEQLLCQCMKTLQGMQMASSASPSVAGSAAYRRGTVAANGLSGASRINGVAVAAAVSPLPSKSNSLMQSPAGSRQPQTFGSGVKRPGSFAAVGASNGYNIHTGAERVTNGLLGSVSGAAVAPAIEVGQPADIFVSEPAVGLAKRSRSFTSLTDGAVMQRATDQQPSRLGNQVMQQCQQQQQQQRRQRRLPVLSQLCLYNCRLAYQALAELVAAAGQTLTRLQLLQLQITSPSVAASAKQQQQQQLHQMQAVINTNSVSIGTNVVLGSLDSGDSCGAGSNSSPVAMQLSHLTAEQLLRLPVSWSNLQELHIQPEYLWGLVKAGCFNSSDRRSGSSSSRSSSVDMDNSSRPTSYRGWQLQQEQQQGSLPTIFTLRSTSQLLSLRHFYVSDQPSGSMGTQPPCNFIQMPLHSQAALRVLLDQLQDGLQQMPALRMLQLAFGVVSPERAGLLVDCGNVWVEAGEKLLAAMPACKVKLQWPMIVMAGDDVQPVVSFAAQELLADVELQPTSAKVTVM